MFESEIMHPIQYTYSSSLEMLYVNYKTKASIGDEFYKILETGLSFLDLQISQSLQQSYRYLIAASLSVLKYPTEYHTLMVHSDINLTIRSGVYGAKTQAEALKLVTDLDQFHTTVEAFLPSLESLIQHSARPLRRASNSQDAMFIEQFGAVYTMLRRYIVNDLLTLQCYMQLSTFISEDLWVKLRLVLQQLPKNYRLQQKLAKDPKLFIGALISVFWISTSENIVELLTNALKLASTSKTKLRLV